MQRNRLQIRLTLKQKEHKKARKQKRKIQKKPKLKQRMRLLKILRRNLMQRKPRQLFWKQRLLKMISQQQIHSLPTMM